MLKCVSILCFMILLLFSILYHHYRETKEGFEISDARFFDEAYHKPYTSTTTRPDCIFVSIASYRDTECKNTLIDIFKKAKEPHKIFIGLCQQNKEENETCIANVEEQYKSHIREYNISYTEARGPTWARYICSHLWDGEEYFMQIDSHSRFLPNWDEKVKNIYKQCPPGKNILTHYPPSHNSYDEIVNNQKSEVSYTCSSHFEKNFHIISEAKNVKNKDKPFTTPYMSAGFMFTTSDLLSEVPFDPYLPYLFQGEEILLSSRFWTSGWNMFNPQEPVITHYYNREKENHPHFWDDHKNWDKIQRETNKRYYYLIGQKERNEVKPEFLTHVEDYGMGTTRSLQDWFDFVGIDMENKKIQSRCKSTYDLETKQWILNE